MLLLKYLLLFTGAVLAGGALAILIQDIYRARRLWRLDSPDDLERATPLQGTAFKVDLARPLIRRAFEAVGA